MPQLLLLFVDICRLRRGPQHVPAAGPLLVIAMLAYTLVNALLVTVDGFGGGDALLQALTDTLVYAGFVWALLRLRGLDGRFVQTFTALTGSGTVLGLIYLLPTWTFAGSEHTSHLAAMALLLLLGWTIAVIGHVLRHALDAGIGTGLAAAVAYIFVSYSMLAWLFGPVTG